MFKNFTSHFISRVNYSPNKPAIIFDGKTITYKELNQQSDDIAATLLCSGAKPEDIISLVLERTPETIIAMIGVLKAGCAFLPISPFAPCARKKFILEDSKSQFVVTNNNSLVDMFNSNIKIITFADIAHSEKYSLLEVSKNHLAYVMYTSGSSGNPKGVLIEHVSMMNLFLSLVEYFGLTENERFLALTDYTFDISLIELIMPLIIGATIVLTEQGVIVDGVKIKNYINWHNITFMQATPVTWDILLRHGWKNQGEMKILVGGEKFSAQLAKSLEYYRGNVFNMYGPTETCMWSMFYSLKENFFTESVPLGKPLKNTAIYVLDSELNEIKANDEGELYISGDGLARGYLNNPKLTQESFIYHPDKHERLYKTGDRVMVNDEGVICFLGRVDEQLKFGGVRIEAGEIENIIEQEMFVKKAIVKTHDQKGHYKSLAAYIEIDEAVAFNDNNITKNIDMSDYFKDIYNETYLYAERYENKNMNTCGWKNSFTGKVFSMVELTESYRFIKKIINESDLSDVLEIGCGTGSILLQFIDKAKSYTVMEISDRAIEYVKNKLNSEQKEKAIFKNKSAIDVCEKKNYSCIIMNSVIQYFPSVNYLISTLKKLVDAAKSNGTIIIGDVRSLELMEVFLLKKIYHKKNSKFQKKTDSFYYKSREAELILSPKFFYALKHEISEISYVDISIKHGSYKNELNDFRYDVILHIKKNVSYQEPLIINYNKLFDKNSLMQAIEANQDRCLIIDKVPNEHIINLSQKIYKVLPTNLKNYFSEGGQKENNKIKNTDYISNYETNSHEKFFMYSRNNPLQELEVHFYPRKTNGKIRFLLGEDCVDLRAYCREPFNPKLQKKYFDQIKFKVAQYLDCSVRPSVYVLVERWPITTNGKLDRKKLQLPASRFAENYPKNTINSLQTIWENITGDLIAVDDNFWMHGMSSLYVHFFLSSVNENYGTSLTYHEIRDYKTLIELANYIDILNFKHGITYSEIKLFKGCEGSI